METWLWIVGALLLGAILGGVGVAVVERRRRGDEESVSRLKSELDEYRQEVSEHFVQTAELVNNLTRSYKAVYDHLEQGAYRLVGEETLQKQLDVGETEPVRLEYIGRRDRTGTPGTTGEVPPLPRSATEDAAAPSRSGAEEYRRRTSEPRGNDEERQTEGVEENEEEKRRLARAELREKEGVAAERDDQDAQEVGGPGQSGERDSVG